MNDRSLVPPSSDVTKLQDEEAPLGAFHPNWDIEPNDGRCLLVLTGNEAFKRPRVPLTTCEPLRCHRVAAADPETVPAVRRPRHWPTIQPWSQRPPF